MDAFWFLNSFNRPKWFKMKMSFQNVSMFDVAKWFVSIFILLFPLNRLRRKTNFNLCVVLIANKQIHERSFINSLSRIINWKSIWAYWSIEMFFPFFFWNFTPSTVKTDCWNGHHPKIQFTHNKPGFDDEQSSKLIPYKRITWVPIGFINTVNQRWTL